MQSKRKRIKPNQQKEKKHKCEQKIIKDKRDKKTPNDYNQK